MKAVRMKDAEGTRARARGLGLGSGSRLQQRLALVLGVQCIGRAGVRAARAKARASAARATAAMVRVTARVSSEPQCIRESLTLKWSRSVRKLGCIRGRWRTGRTICVPKPLRAILGGDCLDLTLAYPVA